MDRKKLLEELDAIYNAGNYETILAFMLDAINRAKSENDWITRVMVGNELMGLYRERGLMKEALSEYSEIRREFEIHGMTEDIAFASTVQNAANLYRASGQLGAAMELFDEVREIYEEQLPETDYRLAGLYNNMGLAYMEKGERFRAREYMEKALRIIEKIPGSEVEQATNHVNLANFYLSSGRMDRVISHLEAADRLFASVGYRDPHYSSLLSLRALVHRKEGDLESAGQDYLAALAEIDKYYGKCRTYAVTLRNLAVVLEEAGKLPEAEERRREAEAVLEDLKA